MLAGLKKRATDFIPASNCLVADDYDRVGLTIAYVYYHPEGKAGQSNGRVYHNMDR